VGYWSAYQGQPLAEFDKENEVGTACVYKDHLGNWTKAII